MTRGRDDRSSGKEAVTTVKTRKQGAVTIRTTVTRRAGETDVDTLYTGMKTPKKKKNRAAPKTPSSHPVDHPELRDRIYRTSEWKQFLAAFFLTTGKDSVTETEMVMRLAMDLKWMGVKRAKALVSYLENKVVILHRVNGGFLAPTFKVSSVKVPLGYKPPESLINSL